MSLTVVRRCFGAVALFGVPALLAACTGSGSTLLSPTGPSASVTSLAVTTTTDCAPALKGIVNTIDEETPEPCATGRFTGGGFQINANDVKVTRGFTLHCDAILSNNFEVNWKDGGTTHNFHTDKNPAVVSCTKPVVPNPPNAPVSKIVIDGQPGTLDGAEGHTITIILEDHGEPGTADRAYIAIDGSRITGGTFDDPALIDGGNIQAHFDQPHKNK